MSNMSYCRFENTLEDLMDCEENMDSRDLSPEEKRARERLIKMCVSIALNHGHEINQEVQVSEKES